MEDFTIFIYIAFIILSLLGGIMKKNKKAQPAQKQKTPASRPAQKPSTAEKSFKELLEEIQRGFAGNEVRPIAQTETAQEDLYESPVSLEDIIIDDDDHHMQGISLEDVIEEETVVSRFSETDWREAIVLSTILDKPKALQNS